jgi:hypothetical protein
MWHFRFFSLILAMTSFVASAQAFTPSRVGNQWLETGLSLQPGLMIDGTAPKSDGFAGISPAFAQMLTLGLVHAVDTRFYAGAELNLGLQWMNEHTASASAKADSEFAFAWQAGLIGRFIPGGDEGGSFGGLGIHVMRAGLEDAPLFVFAAEARVGTLIWFGEEFAKLEVGYAFPFIQGLAFGTNFGGAEPAQSQDWSFHRFLISISKGF